MLDKEKFTLHDKFMYDILQVCKKHNLILSHEDDQGGFLIEKYNEKTAEWLMQAQDINRESVNDWVDRHHWKSEF